MPDRYAVIGHPIAHSKSPQIHAAFARATGQDIVYERILAPLDGFAATVAAFAGEGGRGCNVTLPFKVEAYALATSRAPRAERAGAVNTLIREAGGWRGDNTDGPGLVRDLTHNLDVTLAGRKLLVLGAGGATRGVLGPLLAQRPARLVVANRTPGRAEALVALFASEGCIEAVAPDALRDRFDVVINATSAGIAGEAPPCPASIFAPGALAYDMLYGDAPTPFLRWASACGAARVADGLGMLIEQAAESFLLWRGVRPDTAPVFGLLRPK
jgi:shikimate dehydrogenase